MVYKVADVKQINEKKGQFWFSPNTMQFFRTKVDFNEELHKDKYFITRETNPSGETAFTVREFDSETGDVGTVGEFHKFKSKEEAKKFMLSL